MRPFEMVSALRVDIPMLIRSEVPSNIIIANANPFCPLPFENARYYFEESYSNFEAQLSKEFIMATIVPRGRPHISLLHIALFDDNVATLSFPAITGLTYGQEYRYLESSIAVCFNREVFYRGALKRVPPGAIEVDRYSVEWELLPQSDRIPMLKRGIFRGVCYGHNILMGDKIRVASWEGGFFRRRGVLNQTI